LSANKLRYVVADRKGQWLVLLRWSAAAWRLKARDQSIVWSDEQSPHQNLNPIRCQRGVYELKAPLKICFAVENVLDAAGRLL
jgi:hypothetical protein